MKKIERAEKLVQNHLNTFRCPICHQDYIKLTGNTLVCAEGHTIDFNRHGYLHFLNTQGTTEYDRLMFLSRRRLLEAGLFKPIIEEVNSLLPTSPQSILDVGTGEGTPLAQLAALRHHQDFYVGFDISKPGITLATQLDIDAFFCVADLRQLPFADQSFDTVLELFSPSDYREFNRVLKENGRLMKVIPNGDYLLELRHLLYGDQDQHYHYDNSKVLKLFKQHYPDAEQIPIRYQFNLPHELVTDMIKMTPMSWGRDVHQPTGDDLENLTSITVDVSLLVAKKSN
ncbi:methyltransferase domain-containing protein [Limosilactobacillus sp. c9Ua_26_M]|uniref:Methyltransferase domain-containing protein n=1 Tax=Limosilactobacillus urinaemulieris TaxID=2742600 RepID=A0ABR8ZKM5_9LACO|nr:methyltransferase domain-containing protein [Limosilactobacillus urinaemulieris]MBD8085846.1 methyltransferase domain-containing protein [Limosilactobacillus urinaemulieris]